MNQLQNTSKSILIVGGGIGGLALALALANRGWQTLVFEKASQFGEIGAGIQLGPNAFKAIDQLGILQGLQNDIVFVESLCMMDSVTNKLALEIPLNHFKSKFGYPYGVVHRAHLHNALYQGCQKSQRVQLLTKSEVIDFKDNGQAVSATLADGNTYSGAALVGADGLWSLIRNRLLKDGTPRIVGHIAYRALLEPDEMPTAARWNRVTLWAGPKTHLVHYPISGGKQYNIVATFHSNREIIGWNEEGDLAELHYHFRHIKGLPKEILMQPKNWRRWTLCDRNPSALWSIGRVTLLGDAAHPMLQYFAQGSAMAMEDALVLADQIVQEPDDLATAFQSYQTIRAARTARVQLRARELGEIYHMKGFKRWIRNWKFKRMTPEKFLSGIEWLYHGDFGRDK